MIFGLVGVLVILAAVSSTPRSRWGVDGALKKLLGQPSSPAMFTLVELALFCFGLFFFVEARYRKVLQA